MNETLDKEIVDISGVLSIILVFVFAYSSALYPQIEELRSRPAPSASDDRRAMRSRLGSYKRIAAGLTLVVGLVAALLVPLSVSTASSQPLAPYSTIRLGLLLVEMLLLATAIALLAEVVLLGRREAQLM